MGSCDAQQKGGEGGGEEEEEEEEEAVMIAPVKSCRTWPVQSKGERWSYQGWCTVGL